MPKKVSVATAAGELSAQGFNSGKKQSLLFTLSPHERKLLDISVALEGNKRTLSYAAHGREVPFTFVPNEGPGRVLRKEQFDFVYHTDVGDLTVDFIKGWEDDPIPPRGILAVVCLATKVKGLVQIASIMVDDDGDGIQAKVAAKESNACRSTTLKLI